MCQKPWLETVQNMFEQICRWKKQVFIDQGIALFMLGTNIQNQYGKEMQSTPNMQKHPSSLHELKLKRKINQETINNKPDQSSTS